MTDTPLLDARSEVDVLTDLQERVPGFVPAWQPAPGTAADAVQQVGAGFAAIVVQSINQALGRGQLTFLDACGESRMPAQAASVPLVFTLSDQNLGDAPLAAGTRVAAKPNSGTGVEPLIYSIGQSIALCRAKLAAVYSLDPLSDRCDDHTTSATNGFTLFEGRDVVEHAIYLGHDSLFKLPKLAKIVLSFDLVERQGAVREDLRMKWEYRGADSWCPLQGPVADMLITDGRVDLDKSMGPLASEYTLLGKKSYWLRGSLTEPLLSNGKRDSLPVIDRVRASLNFSQRGLRPDAAFTGSVPVDFNGSFLPFGHNPVSGTAFYLGCSAAFGRPKAQVTLHLGKMDLTLSKTADHDVTWEYFNGDSWQPLQSVSYSPVGTVSPEWSNEDTGTGVRENLFTVTARGVVTFVAPEDWKTATIGGKSSHFLRIGLKNGNVFGTPPKFVPAGNAVKYVGNPKFSPPLVTALSISFSQLTDPTSVDHCITSNASVFEDVSGAARFLQSTFVPFRPTGDAQAAVYFGFDYALPPGLVSLYVEIPLDESGDLHNAISPFTWEYQSPVGWVTLGVKDDTLGFRKSGLIQFIGPFDAIASEGPGGSLYRIRARLKQNAELVTLKVSGVWLNAVLANHAASFGGDILGYSDGMPRQSFSFAVAKTPVHEGEFVQVREWAGTDRGYELAAQDVRATHQHFVRDPVSNAIIELWVQWEPRAHLYGSGPNDRYYTLERATGFMRFGDGQRGRIPPAGAPIRVAFTTGGGLLGNVPADTITELHAALPVVVGVTNPRPARGGSDTESIDVTRRRGAERLRHRDRALAPRDYEWLALQASPAVARAQCLPITGPGGHGQRGWVSIVVFPNSHENQPQPNDELITRVRNYLAARVPAVIAQRLRVLSPMYQAVSVVADIVPHGGQDVMAMDAALRERLNAFLHPLFGGPLGQGWVVGGGVPLSQVAAIIESTPGVDFARDILLQVDDAIFRQQVPGRPETVVAPGPHEIRLTLGQTPGAC